MSSSSDPFSPGSVLWVKCGTLYWPGRIQKISELPADVKESLAEEKKQPQLVVKFFNEDGYEYVYDKTKVFPYNGDRKEEFIKKGVTKSRTKSKEGATGGWFAKFPKDIVLAETLLDGDPDILTKDPYVERNDRVNYKDVFGTPETKKKKDTPGKGGGSAGRGRKRKADVGGKSEPPNKRPIVHPRFQGRASDHQVKILPQPSTPYHLDLVKSQDESETAAAATTTTPTASGSSTGRPSGGSGTPAGAYKCTHCDFSASRLNVLVLHQKSYDCPARKPPQATTSSRRATPASSSKRATPASSSKRTTPASSSRSRAAAAAPSTPPATPTSTTKRGRGRPPANKKPAPAAATPPPAKRGRGRPAKKDTPIATPGSAKKATPEKKTRMTKRKREQMAQEEERKKEERKKLLQDWSDEDDEGLEAEKKKIQDVLEPFVDSSEEEEENENWMMDDNVHGNDYGEDEEEKEKEKETEAETEKETTKDQAPPKESPKDEEREEEKSKQNGKSSSDLELDIGKVLEETSVPDLPPEIDNKAKPAEVETKRKSTRRSVKFAESHKEITQKNFALVEHASNLEAPPMVDDDFDEFVNDYPIPTGPPKVYTAKKILKRNEDTPSKPSETTPLEEPAAKLSAPVSVGEVADDDSNEAETSTETEKTDEKATKVTLAFEADWEEEEETPLIPQKENGQEKKKEECKVTPKSDATVQENVQEEEAPSEESAKTVEMEETQVKEDAAAKVPESTQVQSNVQEQPEEQIQTVAEVQNQPEIQAQSQVALQGSQADVASQPEVAAQPEIASQPEVTAEPAVTSQPEVASQPEVVSQPEAVTQPEVVSQPEVTPQPEVPPPVSAPVAVAPPQPEIVQPQETVQQSQVVPETPQQVSIPTATSMQPEIQQQEAVYQQQQVLMEQQPVYAQSAEVDNSPSVEAVVAQTMQQISEASVVLTADGQQAQQVTGEDGQTYLVVMDDGSGNTTAAGFMPDQTNATNGDHAMAYIAAPTTTAAGFTTGATSMATPQQIILEKTDGQQQQVVEGQVPQTEQQLQQQQ